MIGVLDVITQWRIDIIGGYYAETDTSHIPLIEKHCCPIGWWIKLD